MYNTAGSLTTGTIVGKVTESDGITPIPDVLVEALQGTLTIGTTTTNANGSYSISLASGTYTVRVSKQQYLSVETTDIVVSQGTTTYSNFILYSARIKPIISSPQSAGSEVLLKVQVGDEQSPVKDLFTLFGTLTYTSANDIEILKVAPGDFIGNDLQIFNIVKSEGKVQFMMRRKTGAGGVTGYGSVLDIKLKIFNQAQLGTITFSLDGLAAYNSTVQWISLLPESKEMRINNVPIKPVVYPPILPGQEFEVNIQIGDINNEVSGLKSVSFDMQWEETNMIEILTPVAENVKPGELLGTNTFIFAVSGTRTLSICVGRFSGESNGFGLVAKIRLKILSSAKPGTMGTLTISNVLAYNPDACQIKLIPVICPFTIELLATWTQVWPGDTDNDGIVNEWDIVPIAFYLSKTGPERGTVSIGWKPWPAQYWNFIEPPCQDAVYADSNGDGVVNIADVHALIMNNGRTHPKTTPLSAPMKTDNSWLEKYQEVLKNRPDLLANVKYVLAGLEGNTESQKFIEILQEIIAPLSLSEFKAYPNPYRPTTIHSSLAGIKFTNLGTNWDIKVYNIAGEEVAQMQGIGNDYVWGTAKDLASGVYIYIVNSTTLSKKTGKLAIIK
ncbi:MAG: carboxypeptidase regulatory-like domain-containing protein [bacterium]|nr:carboxypeptidase regulatory-like domain-containing protein [bacterium]